MKITLADVTYPTEPCKVLQAKPLLLDDICIAAMSAYIVNSALGEVDMSLVVGYK